MNTIGIFRKAAIRAIGATRRFSAQSAATGGLATRNDIVLLYTTWGDVAEDWAESLRQEGMPVRLYPREFEEQDLANVRFAVCWKPPAGLLKQCPSLTAVQSLGAGVDHLLGPDIVPAHIPVARIVDPLMGERMATWVLWAVINTQRRMDAYWQAQREGRWDPDIEPRGASWDNGDVRIGVMGAGVMGGATADLLHHVGYNVTCWSRTKPKAGAAMGYARAHGADALPAFLGSTDVLVCLLPLTPETHGIIDAGLLAALPHGASVINAARGKLLVEQDLLQALDSGHIRSAVLDVTDPEPLPAASRLWRHPSVRITPHVSSMTNLSTAIQQIAANYRRALEGRPMHNLVDLQRGY